MTAYRKWIICVGCTLLLICTMGFSANVFSIYLPYLEGKYLTGAQSSALISIRCLFGIVGMLLIDHYYRFFSLRTGLVAALLITAFSHVMYAFAVVPWQFYAAAAVCGLGYGFGAMIPVSLLIRNWFHEHRGVALGICASGSGISTILFPPILTALIENRGITASFLFQAFFALIIAALFYWVVRDKPEDSATVNVRTAREKKTGERHRGMTLLACLLIGAVSSSAPGHFSIHFANSGYPMMAVSAAVSIYGIALTCGKALCGICADRFGGRFTSIAFATLIAVGGMICRFANGTDTYIMYCGVLLMGSGLALATIGLPIWVEDLYGEENYQTNLKRCQIVYAGGGMIFSVMPGILYDRTGTYGGAYLVMALFSLAVLVMIDREYGRRKTSGKAGQKI